MSHGGKKPDALERRVSIPTIEGSGDASGSPNEQRAAIVAGATAIAKGIVEIAKIHYEAEKQLAVIDAEGRALEKRVIGEIQLLSEQRHSVRDRGQVAIDILREVRSWLDDVPATDSAQRMEVMKMAVAFVNSALKG